MAQKKVIPKKIILTKKVEAPKKNEVKKAVKKEVVQTPLPEMTKQEDYSVKFVFTQDEILEKSKKMVDTISNIHGLNDELNSIKTNFKSKISAQQAIVDELAGDIRSGYTYNKVLCNVKMNDPLPGKKTYYYNGEIVENSTQQMLASDFQAKLEFEKLLNPGPDSELNMHIMVIEGSKIITNEIIIDTAGLKQLLKKCVDQNNPVIKSIDSLLDNIKRIGTSFDFDNNSDGQTIRKHLEEKGLLITFLNLF
jgi:hypothetical protein